MKRYPICLILLCILSAATQAGELTQVAEGDRFHLAVGSYLITNSETELRYTSPYLLGLTLNTSRDLDMDRRDRVARLDGYYRFTPAHALHFTWYDIQRRGLKSISKDIEWGDVTFPVGASIESRLDTEVLKLAYNYSFYHNEKVELGIGAGLHITKVTAGLAGIASSGSRSNVETSTTAPLPVVGARLNYWMTPKFSFRFALDIFGIEIGNYAGTFTDIDFRLLYQFGKHLGVGGGFNVNSLNLEQNENGHTLEVNNDLGGVTLFLTLNY